MPVRRVLAVYNGANLAPAQIFIIGLSERANIDGKPGLSRVARCILRAEYSVFKAAEIFRIWSTLSSPKTFQQRSPLLDSAAKCATPLYNIQSYKNGCGCEWEGLGERTLKLKKPPIRTLS